RSITSSAASRTTSLRPVVSETTVSGVASMVSIRSALTTRVSPPSRVSSITSRPPAGPGPPGPRAGATAPAAGAAAPPLPQPYPCSTPQVDELLKDLVRGRDHPRVGLETALGHDHVGKLLRQVDIGHLQRARDDVAEPPGPRYAHGSAARVVGLHEQ